MPSSRSEALWLCALLACGAASSTAWPSSARADGAFPDSLGILLPRDQPQRIITSTNFGLLLSEDDGATWGFICEEAVGMLASIYQVGPPPDDRLFSVTVDGLMVSTDAACSWEPVMGLGPNASDVFPDPNDPLHVLAIAQTPSTPGAAPPPAIFESQDGGKTFADTPRYTGQSSADLTGVEIAKSDSSIVYVAMYTYAPPPVRAFLVRSSDAGQSWETTDLSPTIGTMIVRILAVDPKDPNKVYLRIFDNGFVEQLGVYDHAHGKLELPLQLEHRMSAFLVRSDGAVIVATQDGAAFISTDDAQSFAPWPNVPHLRAIGERDGLLYAAANDAVDGYAVGVSSDLGASWQPLVSFDQVKGPLICGNIAERCAIPWQNFLATIAMPSREDPLPGFDMDSGSDSSSAAPAGNPSGSGCRCSAPAGGPRSRGWGFAALALVAAFRVHRRRS